MFVYVYNDALIYRVGYKINEVFTFYLIGPGIMSSIKFFETKDGDKQRAHPPINSHKFKLGTDKNTLISFTLYKYILYCVFTIEVIQGTNVA